MAAQFQGFTLTELLIALAILGVIATFTIPKVLQAQRNVTYNSIAKEAAGTISSAYIQYKMANGTNPTMQSVDLKPYFNYVKEDSTTTLDQVQTQGFVTCGASGPCILLHNGAMIWFIGGNFGGAGPLNFVRFLVDPDGRQTDGTTNGPGKSIQFYLYTDGKLRTRGTIEPNSCDDGGCIYNPNSALDPPWFSWN